MHLIPPIDGWQSTDYRFGQGGQQVNKRTVWTATVCDYCDFNLNSATAHKSQNLHYSLHPFALSHRAIGSSNNQQPNQFRRAKFTLFGSLISNKSSRFAFHCLITFLSSSNLSILVGFWLFRFDCDELKDGLEWWTKDLAECVAFGRLNWTINWLEKLWTKRLVEKKKRLSLRWSVGLVEMRWENK